VTGPFQPSWVMCGVEAGPGRVVLLASKDLTEVELQTIADDEADLWFTSSPLFVHERRYVLNTTMRSFVHIQATNWPEAFQRLFQTWTPDAEPRRELASTLALPTRDNPDQGRAGR
jgi:hypothetical protein